MLTITKLKMWKDPGYTRQCVEVPPVGSWKLPGTPDYTSSEDLRPRRGSTLSAMELPLSYLAVHDMSYLYMEIEDGVTPTPNTMKIFGWITHIEEIASSAEAVRIEWTPDYWRTYADDATFGKGVITRCNNATYKRPYESQPRKMVYSKSVDPFYDANNVEVMFVMMVSETSGNDVTGFSFYYSGLDWVDPNDAHTRSPKLTEVYGGLIDEVTGVIPSSIIGCWILPSGIATFNSLFGPNYTVVTTTYGGDDVIVRKSTGAGDHPITSNVTVTGLSGYLSDDMNKCVLVNPYGDVESVLPWGYGFTSNAIDIVTNLSSEGITVYIIQHGLDFKSALSEGNFLSFSGLPVPVNTNAWSEYAYTYQRSYDKRIAEIQRNQQTVSGLTGIGQSAVGGAVAGAMSGSGPIGAIVGASLGLISPVVNYYASGYFNDELQKETDKLISNQTSNMIMAGGGPAWNELIGGWRIIQLTADTVSATEYSQFVSNEGYTTEIPVNDPSASFTAGGPLQIQNLVVTGAIPPEAKTYIKNILSNGVRIVENNPSGVVP